MFRNKINEMLKLKVVPCSICGELPIICGGDRSGRLKCPNYKSKEILHGNLSSDTNGLTMGFTNWCNYFWSDEQIVNEGIPRIVAEWNYIQENHIDNCEYNYLNINDLKGCKFKDIYYFESKVK